VNLAGLNDHFCLSLVLIKEKRDVDSIEIPEDLILKLKNDYQHADDFDKAMAIINQVDLIFKEVIKIK